MTTERYVYKLRPNYSHTQKITLRQIHILNDEYDTITSQQKLSQVDRERLVEIDKLTEIWTKHDIYEDKQNLFHKADNYYCSNNNS